MKIRLPFFISEAGLQEHHSNIYGGRHQSSSTSQHHLYPHKQPKHLDGKQSPFPLAPYGKCLYCKEVIPQSSIKIKQHIAQYHINEMPFWCELCGKGFLTSSGLMNHVQAHEGRKFMCQICDFKFKQKGHLKNHLKNIHKLALCPVCSKALNLGLEFHQHVLHCS